MQIVELLFNHNVCIHLCIYLLLISVLLLLIPDPCACTSLKSTGYCTWISLSLVSLARLACSCRNRLAFLCFKLARSSILLLGENRLEMYNAARKESEESALVRKYWMTYRGPGFLAFPTSSPPVSKLSLFLSLSVCLQLSLLTTGGRRRGWGMS